MAIELEEYNWTARTLKSGTGNEIAVTAGQWLQIRTGLLVAPSIELEEQCPVGKVWSIHILVQIDESDA